MPQIIFLILKIIGITLLSVIGLVLLLLILALLVPVRYRVDAQFKDGADIRARIGLLFHILHASLFYAGGQPHIRFYVFGIRAYDSQRPAKSRKAGRKSTHRMKSDGDETYASEEDKPIPGDEARNDATEYKIGEGTTADTVLMQKDTEHMDAVYREAPHRDEQYRDETYREAPHKERPRRDEIYGEAPHSARKKRRKGIFSSISGLRRKLELIKDFLKDEITKAALGTAWKSFVKLIKHLAPTKLKADIIFGTGDPCSTGRILGVLAFFYGMYGEHVSLTPDFENKILEGKLYARGRIRLITVLIIVVKLLIDKKFKEMLNNFKSLKEALS